MSRHSATVAPQHYLALARPDAEPSSRGDPERAYSGIRWKPGQPNAGLTLEREGSRVANAGASATPHPTKAIRLIGSPAPMLDQNGISSEAKTLTLI
jgi:hypothetical protein